LYELHVRITQLSTVTARIDALEPACHLAQLLRVASGFRTCVRTPDGDVIGDVAALSDGTSQGSRSVELWRAT
jgi:hypothetical protein